MRRIRDRTEECLIRRGILNTASLVEALAICVGESALTTALIVRGVSDLGIEESLDADEKNAEVERDHDETNVAPYVACLHNNTHITVELQSNRIVTKKKKKQVRLGFS